MSLSTIILFTIGLNAFAQFPGNGFRIPGALYFEGTLQVGSMKQPVKYGYELSKTGNVNVEEMGTSVNVYGGFTVRTGKLCDAKAGKEYVVVDTPFFGSKCRVQEKTCDLTVGKMLVGVMFARSTGERCATALGAGQWYNETVGSVSYGYCATTENGFVKILEFSVSSSMGAQRLVMTKWAVGRPPIFVDTSKCPESMSVAPYAVRAKMLDKGKAALALIEDFARQVVLSGKMG